MCRVIWRSEPTKTHMFARLPKSLRISENIESRKLSTLYVGENEKQPSYGFVEPSVGLNWLKYTFLKLEQIRWEFRRMVRLEGYLFHNYFQKKWKKLSNVCLKPSKSSKVTKIPHVESLANPPVESFLFHISEQMKLTLLWVCRVGGRSKLIQIHKNHWEYRRILI